MSIGKLLGFGFIALLVAIPLLSYQREKAAQEAAQVAAAAAEKATKAEAARVATLSPAQVSAEAKAQAEAAAEKVQRELEWQFVQTCQFTLKPKLHDPASAEWIDLSRSYREHKGDRYMAQLKLRAKNAMGALRLSTYECRGQRMGNAFAIASIKAIN